MSQLTIEISEKLEYLQTVVSHFEKLVGAIDNEFPPPSLIEYDERYVFRHEPSVRSDTLASYLKLVRIVSLLKASLHLIHCGHVQEVYILCRSIDEAEDDIIFFALSLGDNGTDKKQIRLLNEFYQEEHDDPSDPLSNSKRDRVKRNNIWAASANIPNGYGDPSTFLKNAKSIYSTFSGYVHGTYVSIMEMYHPNKKSYQMCGMPNSSRTLECVNNLPNHIYRSLSALETLCYRIGRTDIAKSALNLNVTLVEKTGCMDEEGLNSLKRRLQSELLKKFA